jgi:hypothetical protein
MPATVAMNFFAGLYDTRPTSVSEVKGGVRALTHQCDENVFTPVLQVESGDCS